MNRSGGKGYWIGPEEKSRPSDTSGGTSAPTPSPERSSVTPGSRNTRRLGLAVGLSLCALVALAIVTGLTLTGRIVVPVVSAKLFPIHYRQEIAQVAAKYDQDPYLVAAMVKTESGFDAEARSGVGATGLMQLMPATAEWVAEQSGEWPQGESPVLTNPLDNLELGVWYLDYLGGLYGQGSLLALASYNAGLGNVDEWIAEIGDADSFDAEDIPFPETRDYVERVEHYKRLYERVHPDAFAATAP